MLRLSSLEASRLARSIDQSRVGNRVSAEELRCAIAASPAPKKRHGKFNAIKVDAPEGRFDSKMEYERFLTLRLLERAGEISDLRRQIPYKLEAGGIHISTYVADFVYKKADVVVVEDAKGFRTGEYRQKRRLMKEILGIVIFESGRPEKNKRRKADKSKGK